MQFSSFSNVVMAFVSTFQNILVSLPGCPWCVRARGLLQDNCIEFYEFEVTGNRYITPGGNLPNFPIQELQNYYSYSSYPMIFLNGEFIKGYSNLEAMVNSGEIENYKTKTKITSRGN